MGNEDLEKTNDQKLKLEIISKQIVDITQTIHRQIAFYRFEKQIHDLRKKGELDAKTIDRVFQKETQAMFGRSLKLTDQHTNFWQYVSHFINTSFYVYAYAFGGLISFSLYGKYKSCKTEQDRKKFISSYKQMLSMGGSASPQNILKIINININDKTFWQGGIEIIKQKIIQQEKIIKKLKK